MEDLICDSVRARCFVGCSSFDSIADLLNGNDWLEWNLLWVLIIVCVSEICRWRCWKEGAFEHVDFVRVGGSMAVECRDECLSWFVVYVLFDLPN